MYRNLSGNRDPLTMINVDCVSGFVFVFIVLKFCAQCRLPEEYVSANELTFQLTIA